MSRRNMTIMCPGLVLGRISDLRFFSATRKRFVVQGRVRGVTDVLKSNIVKVTVETIARTEIN